LQFSALFLECNLLLVKKLNYFSGITNYTLVVNQSVKIEIPGCLYSRGKYAANKQIDGLQEVRLSLSVVRISM
jgi:hypothetical protein